MKPGVCFLAHHDIFAKDAPDSFQAKSLEAQFACNVYLNMPTEGGALQMWDDDISPDQFDEMRGDSYGIDPALLGPRLWRSALSLGISSCSIRVACTR